MIKKGKNEIKMIKNRFVEKGGAGQIPNFCWID